MDGRSLNAYNFTSQRLGRCFNVHRLIRDDDGRGVVVRITEINGFQPLFGDRP